MDVKLLAVILLAGRLVTLSLIVVVIKLQLPLFKVKDQPELIPLRRVLFTLSSIIATGISAFILLDIATIFDLVQRSTNHINGIGIASSLTNLFVLQLATFIIWLLYRVAAKTLLIVEHDKDVALEKKAKVV